MSAPVSFWCHQCRKRIDPSAAFACGTCGSEFIEQMDVVDGSDLMDQDSPEEFIQFELPPFQQQTPAAGPQQAQQPPPVFRDLFGVLNGMLQQQAQQVPQPPPQHHHQPHAQFFPMGGGNNNFVFHANFANVGGPQAGAFNPFQYACFFDCLRLRQL